MRVQDNTGAIHLILDVGRLYRPSAHDARSAVAPIRLVYPRDDGQPALRESHSYLLLQLILREQRRAHSDRTFPRSSSHAAKHRTWAWYFSMPAASPSRPNSICISVAEFLTGRLHTEQSAPTPGPPQVRSAERAGILPVLIASRTCPRRIGSSGMVAPWSEVVVVPDATSNDARVRQPEDPQQARTEYTLFTRARTKVQYLPPPGVGTFSSHG